MTPEEFLSENQSKTSITTQVSSCDPCQLARVSRSKSSDDLDPSRCFVVDKDGRAVFMVITEDGRWIPAEDY